MSFHIKLIADILSATIIFAVPLLLVALGGMFSERSGIINIALEGIMIVGALAGTLTLRAFNLGSFGPAHPQLAMSAAILLSAVCGSVFSLLLAFASINLRADQTIGGTALNMAAPALAIVITWAVQGQGKTTILTPSWIRITAASVGERFTHLGVRFLPVDDISWCEVQLCTRRDDRRSTVRELRRAAEDAPLPGLPRVNH